jgi:aconitate hydratase
MPAGAKVLPLRSNIPAISEFVYTNVDPTFATRAKEAGGGFIVGGENYGQGSSREHAALAPMYLGIKACLVKSFARIHRANLVNFGILPLTFIDPASYDAIGQGDDLELSDVRNNLKVDSTLTVTNRTKGTSFEVKHDLTARQIEIMLAGGLLNLMKSKQAVKK